MPLTTSEASQTHWDYVLVGGGLSGSVIASRLMQKDSKLKLLVIEAGPDANDRTDIVWPNSTNLIGGDFDWKDSTVAQKGLDDRVVSYPLGKALGGGTVINAS
jgi:choline dehydrogenase